MDKVGFRPVIKPSKEAVLAAILTAFLLALTLLLTSLNIACVKQDSNAAPNREAANRLTRRTPPMLSTQRATEPSVPASVNAGARPLSNAQPSAVALARRFLQLLASGDVQTMRSLRLTKQEFCQYVFRELPSSKIPNVTCDFVWDQATLKSISGMSEMLPRHKGKQYELISVGFAKGTDQYPTYRVHKEAHLVVKDESGAETEVRLFGSMLEMDGQFKLFSFALD
jgi:hypothetical protein